MAVDIHLAPASECPSLDRLRFGSMGDIGRASREFSENFRNIEAREVLDSYRQYRLSCIRTSLSLLKKAVLPKRILISARLKRLESVYRKMQRNPDNPPPLNGMDDVIGFRIICESFDDAVALGEQIENEVPARTKNYIEKTHEAGIGYRAIHGIARFGQPLGDAHVTVRFEIQIRTWYQHLWACWCESYGEQAKEGFSNPERTDREIMERQKEDLNDCSRRVAAWEEMHRGERQEELPPFINPYSLAVAWVKLPDDYDFLACGTDVDSAVRNLRYLEDQRGLRPLLLVGVADSPHLKSVLARTHPNFVGGMSLDPQHWLPDGA